MKITKKQLKRIIREEYSSLKQRGLIREMNMGHDPLSDIGTAILQIITEQPGIDGYTLADMIEKEFGEGDPTVQEILWSELDAMTEAQEIWLDDQQDAWYIWGSPEADAAVEQYTDRR